MKSIANIELRSSTFLVLTFLSSIAISADYDVDPELEQQVSKLAGPEGLSAEQRQIYVDYIHRRMVEPGAGRDIWRHYLTILGDEQTIREAVAGKDVWGMRDALVASGSPIAIEALAPTLFINEPFQQSSSDAPFVSASFQVASPTWRIRGRLKKLCDASA
jgi:hypothetical protein